MLALPTQPFLFPNAATRSGSWGLMLWAYVALERWAGIGSQGPTPGYQIDCNDFERHWEGVGAGSLFSQGDPLPSVHFLL